MHDDTMQGSNATVEPLLPVIHKVVLTSPHPTVRVLRPNIRAALAAACTGDVRLDVGEPDVVGPTVSVGFDVMAAP
jgi:hypothetical protein